MSDIDNQQLGAVPQVPVATALQEAVAVAVVPAVAVAPLPVEQPPVAPQPAPVAPVVPATHAEVHTSLNTPMKARLAPVSPLIRELTEGERSSGGYMTVYLGNSKQSQEAARTLMNQWLTISGTRSLADEGRVNESTLNKAISDWEEYVDKNFPGKDPDEMIQYAAELYTFSSEVLDEVKVRSKVMNEDGITNVSNRGGNFITGDIVAKTPGRGTKGFSPSELMRRTALKANNDKLAFDVLLRDSFVALTFTRPNRLEMGDLMNDIRRTIKGYVRSINNNSAVLSRIAAARVLWEFLAKRITSSSVSGIGDFAQLGNVILLTDIDQLVTALLESMNTKGVNLNLRCLGACNWDSFQLVDPSKFSQIRGGIETDAEAAIYGNLINAKVKYTVEETLAFSSASTYGLESNKVYNDAKNLYFEIAPPTLADAFNTFDYFVGKINPQLADIRNKVIDPEEYETQVTMAHNELGSAEFIHWISAYVSMAPAGTDEEDIILRRADTDDVEFNKGLMSIILDHDDLNRNLTKFILNKTPYMSRTFVGIPNYVCPTCGKDSGALQDPENFLDRKSGYTPIDPIMSFFIHTQLNMLSQAVESNQAKSEALSE